MATQEKMTITQLIAEKKKIENKIFNIVGSKDFSVVQFYAKNRQFIGARSTDECEKKIKADMQSVNDLLVRWNAINKARVKANAETLVEVDTIVTPLQAFNGEEPQKEKISIAEAILRKKWFKENLTVLVASLKNTYMANLKRKDKLEMVAEEKINMEISQRFPQDANKNWSQETLKKAKDELKTAYAVERIDPNDVIANDGIAKFESFINDYIATIDTALSIVNAKTEVIVEY